MYNITVWPLEPCAHSVHAVPGFMGPPRWFLSPQKTENQAVGGFIQNKRGVPPKQKMLICVVCKIHFHPTEILKVNKKISTWRGKKNQIFPSKGVLGTWEHYPSFTP